MRLTRFAAVPAALSVLLLLAGCGLLGGTSDESSSGSMPGSGSVRDPAPAAPGLADAQTADPKAVRATGEQAANALPAFGSVTQSSNIGMSGTTTDTATTALDGSRLRLTVGRMDGSTLTLDSDSETSDFQDFDFPVDGRSGRAYVLLDFGELSLTGTSISVAAVYTSWNDDDPMNYLAGGYWLHVEGNLFEPEDIEVEIGAFMDGPELSGTPALPGLGTASYRGPATGIYAYEYGSGHVDRMQGSAAAGEFFGIAELEADFGAGAISGSIGETIVSAVGATPDGDGFELQGEETGLRVDLGPTALGPNGRFSGREVSVASTDPNRTVTGSSGSWGGLFSNILEAGEPRLVGGTAGAEWEESDGSQGVLLGAFFGARNQPSTTAEQ